MRSTINTDCMPGNNDSLLRWKLRILHLSLLT